MHGILLKKLLVLLCLLCMMPLHSIDAERSYAQVPAPLPLRPAIAAGALVVQPLAMATLGVLDGPLLLIPALDVVVPVTRFPLDGVSWAIDPWEVRVGHLQGTAWVGAVPGNVAIGGHAEYPNGMPGVFYELATLAMGDTVILIEQGYVWRYEIFSVGSVAYDDLSVVYPTQAPQLTLITCDIPTYNTATGQYDERLVIRTQPG